MTSLRQRIAFHESGHVGAALIYNVPVVHVTIEGGPHVRRARYRAPRDLGLEAIVVLCLAGRASEQHFCGRITDGSDQADLAMARDYLRSGLGPLHVEVEFARYRDRR